MQTTAVLVDDHEAVRRGVRSLLSTGDGVEIVGEASDGRAAFTLIESTRPEVCIVDLVLPGLSGFELIRQLRRAQIPTVPIVLSFHESESYVWEALSAGAKAYIPKSADLRELFTAIREGLAGRTYLCPPLTDLAARAFVASSQQGGGSLGPLTGLTSREREVLQLVAEGRSSRDVADLLCISRRTVESHRSSLMRKLGLHRQAELIRFAVSNGLVPESSPVAGSTPARS